MILFEHAEYDRFFNPLCCKNIADQDEPEEEEEQ